MGKIHPKNEEQAQGKSLPVRKSPPLSSKIVKAKENEHVDDEPEKIGEQKTTIEAGRF